VKQFHQFIAESDEEKSKDKESNEPKLSEFESNTRKLPLGTVLIVQQGTGFQAKTFYVVKGEEDEWHQIDHFQQQGKTLKGDTKDSKFSTQNIVRIMQQIAPGIKKPGERVLNIFQLAVLPDRSVIEFTHHLMAEKPEVYQKINGLWHKPNDSKGYDSSLFDSQLEFGTWIWKH